MIHVVYRLMVALDPGLAELHLDRCARNKAAVDLVVAEIQAWTLNRRSGSMECKESHKHPRYTDGLRPCAALVHVRGGKQHKNSEGRKELAQR